MEQVDINPFSDIDFKVQDFFREMADEDLLWTFAFRFLKTTYLEVVDWT